MIYSGDETYGDDVTSPDSYPDDCDASARHARRCDHWHPETGRRCASLAVAWLISPDGRRCPGGPLCNAHLTEIIAEYAAGLGETWAREEITP